MKMINPVFRRELRTVLRTWKTFTVIMLYIMCLAGVSAVYLAVLVSESYYSGFSPKSALGLYNLLSGFQLGLVLIIVPALTGGAISNERERQTLDLMLVTKMSTFSIIIGKLLSSIMVVILMITASMPVFSVLLYYGGVSVQNLAAMLLFTVSVALMAGSVSVFLSSVYKKTIISIVLTYVIILILCIATFLFALVSNRLWQSLYNTSFGPWQLHFLIMSMNPFAGYASILDNQLGSTMIVSVMDSFHNYNRNITNHSIVNYLWLINVLFNLVLSASLSALGAVLINPVKTSKKYK